MNMRIYVAMYKPNNFVLKIKNPIYIPIQCGRAINGNFNNSPDFLPELGDNTGDNISNKNPYYSELTALYWIWKNDDSQPDDIVGLNHYRRYFAEPSITGEDSNILLGGRTIKKMLKDNNYIVNGCGVERNEFEASVTQYYSAYNNYRGSHVVEDLDNALKCIRKLFPDLYDEINFQVKNIGAMCLNNMMIARKKDLDAYCSFIFSVFRMLEYYIDFDGDDHQGYQERVFGFLNERLFRPWIKASGRTAVQGPALDFEKYSGYVWE